MKGGKRSLPFSLAKWGSRGLGFKVLVVHRSYKTVGM